MRTSKITIKIAAATMALTALFAVAAPAVAAPAVSVQGVAVEGNTVSITVRNDSSVPMVRTVAVQAIVANAPIWIYVPVLLGAGQTASVSTTFSATVGSVSSVSLTDDPTPW
jgi:uncharacterized protein (DUF58 family)